MKLIREYIFEKQIENINVPSEIEKDGIKYKLSISKNYDAIGKNKKGFIAQYIDYKNAETLVGFEGKNIKDIEHKINDYIKNEKY